MVCEKHPRYRGRAQRRLRVDVTCMWLEIRRANGIFLVSQLRGNGKKRQRAERQELNKGDQVSSLGMQDMPVDILK